MSIESYGFSKDPKERDKEMRLHLLNSLKKAKNQGLKNLAVTISGNVFVIEAHDFDKAINGLTKEVYG